MKRVTYVILGSLIFAAIFLIPWLGYEHGKMEGLREGFMENATWIILGVALMVVLVYVVPVYRERSDPDRRDRVDPPVPVGPLAVVGVLIVLAIIAQFVW